jgi:hypothetical protein
LCVKGKVDELRGRPSFQLASKFEKSGEEVGLAINRVEIGPLIGREELENGIVDALFYGFLWRGLLGNNGGVRSLELFGDDNGVTIFIDALNNTLSSVHAISISTLE